MTYIKNCELVWRLCSLFDCEDRVIWNIFWMQGGRHERYKITGNGC